MTKLVKLRISRLVSVFVAVCSLLGLAYAGLYTAARPVSVEQTLSPLVFGKNSAVFAAYSADGTISDYVIDYLRALKQIAPNIVYVTDNPIPEREIAKLRPYVNHLIAGRHGEYDWGSYKRGFAWLKQQNVFTSGTTAAAPSPISDTNTPSPVSGTNTASEASVSAVPLLILANDSTLLVAPTLRPVLQAAYNSGADIFGITANTDGIYHLQSYFLALTPRIYNTPEFAAYLNAVRPEKDGLTVAARYEVPFTAYFTGLGFTSAAYIPYEQLSWLPLNDKNCYPLTMLSKYHAPFLKMRTFTTRLNVQEPRRLVFAWLKKNAPDAYNVLLQHLQKINSPYLNKVDR